MAMMAGITKQAVLGAQTGTKSAAIHHAHRLIPAGQEPNGAAGISPAIPPPSNSGIPDNYPAPGHPLPVGGNAWWLH